MGTASATDYYVNNTGNNGLAGTSPETAWDTITYAATQATTPGDHVHIKGGDYGHEHIVTVYSGTDGSPIIFDGYGGEVIINNSDGNGYSIYGYNDDWIEFRNITTEYAQYGFCYEYCDNITHRNVTSRYHAGGLYAMEPHFMKIYDSDFHDCSGSGSVGVILRYAYDCLVQDSNAEGSAQDYGFLIRMGERNTFRRLDVPDIKNHGLAFRGGNHSIMENCTAAGSLWEEFAIKGEELVLGTIITNHTIRDCTIYNEAEYGLIVDSSEYHAYISGTNIINLSIINNVSSAGPGIYLWDNVSGSIITNVSITNSTYPNGAIRLRGSCDNEFTDIEIDSDSYDYYLQASDTNSSDNLILDNYQNLSIRLLDASSSVDVSYTDGTVFTAGAVAVHYWDTGRSSFNYWETGTQTINTIVYSNIKLYPSANSLKDIVVNTYNVSDVNNITINSTVAENPTWINITVDNASHIYNISRDGIHYDTVTSGSDSVARYHYSISGNEWSNHSFEFTWASTGAPVVSYDSNITLVQATNYYALNWDPSDAVSHWTFDNQSLLDENTTNSHDATTGGAAYNSSGKYGGARDFSTDDIINTTLTDNFAQITLSTWIYIPDRSVCNGARLFDKESNLIFLFSNGSEYTPGYGDNGISFYHAFSTTAGQWYTPSNTITEDTWHHVLVTYDNTNVVNNPIIYIDGVVQTIDERTTPDGTASTNANDITIGNRDALDRGFIGTIDDTRIWDRVISQSEVNQTRDNEHKTTGNITYDYTDFLDIDEELTTLRYNGSTPTAVLNNDLYSSVAGVTYDQIQLNASTNTNYDVSSNNYEYARLNLKTSDDSETPVIYNFTAEYGSFFSIIIIPANTYGMINNWTGATNFTNIATAESNDVCYTYYNVVTGEWESYYVGHSWNADYTIPVEASVFMFVNAETTITATTVTPSNTNLYTGWNMLFVEGTDNETIADIIADIGANCTDVWAFNSSSGEYTNTSTYSVQPNQGVVAYITQNMTWTRSDL